MDDEKYHEFEIRLSYIVYGLIAWTVIYIAGSAING